MTSGRPIRDLTRAPTASGTSPVASPESSTMPGQSSVSPRQELRGDPSSPGGRWDVDRAPRDEVLEFVSV